MNDNKNNMIILTYFDLVLIKFAELLKKIKPINYLWKKWEKYIIARIDATERAAKSERVRKYLFCTILFIIHGFTFYLVYSHNPDYAVTKYFPIPITAFLGELFIVIYIYDGKQFYIKNEFSLYRQLEEYHNSQKSGGTIKEELPTPIRKWYKDHLKPMYGYTDDEKLNNNISSEMEKKGVNKAESSNTDKTNSSGENKSKDKDYNKAQPFWWFSAPFLILWVGFAVVFPSKKLDDAAYWVSKIVDSIVYWIIVAYALRVIIRSVKIIKDYESKGLSAPFSRFNNHGFNFLVQAWKKMMLYFLPFWILFWVYGGFAYKHVVVSDTLAVSTGIIFAGFWSIRTSKRTISLSKKIRCETLYKYEKTILEKRDELLKNPTNASLLDLNKATKIYREYEKIMMKDFNANYIIAVFLNLWVFLIPLLYWLVFVIFYKELNIEALYAFATF